MFPAAFDYLQAHSADEALAALAQHGGDARVLAGGQSLIPAMRFRLAQPAILLDINPIAELAYMREGDGLDVYKRQPPTMMPPALVPSIARWSGEV